MRILIFVLAGLFLAPPSGLVQKKGQ